MRLGSMTWLIIIIGISLQSYTANAVIIKPSNSIGSDYKLHHKIIIYNDLSSFQNLHNHELSDGESEYNKIYLSKKIKKAGNLEREEKQLTQRPLEDTNQKLKFSYSSLASNKARNIEEDKDGSLVVPPVGGFLDTFKDDPTFRTIYFTSRALKFSYQKNVANIFSLGFQMDADDYKKDNPNWNRINDDPIKVSTEKEKKNLAKEGKILFGLISESYKTILYSILAMIAALYFSIRYILSKYI